MNWEALCLQAEELSASSEALRNRRRIQRILERTNKLWSEIGMQAAVQGVNLEDQYDGDCPEHGYDGKCRPGLSVGSSIYEDEDDANGFGYKAQEEVNAVYKARF